MPVTTDPADLPDPDTVAARAMAGMVLHYIASDPERALAFARWIHPHGPGCEGVEGVAAEIPAYFAKCHAIIEPGCRIPVTADIGTWDAYDPQAAR